MDPPPLSTTTTTTAIPPPTTTDSVDSSPRSRHTDSFDDTHSTTLPKLRLMCSFGGHIVPRPHDKSLCYVGGDTRIIVVDRQTTLTDLTKRLSKTLLNNKTPFTLKYQLPNEDLDSLISVTTDEDLDNMIDEYDRLNNNASSAGSKSTRLRLFLFPTKPDSVSSIGSLLENSVKSEDWFLNALNGSTSGGLSDSNSVNCLLGLDDDDVVLIGGNSKGVIGGAGAISGKSNQDVHSVPDSPMLETNSSFGSASSSPSLANLPPIRVHTVEEHKDKEKGVVGIEGQFGELSVGGGGNVNLKQQDDGAFVGMGSVTQQQQQQPSVPLSSVPVPVIGGEYSNRIYSDDERSDGGGYRKQQQQMPAVPSQLQQKQAGGGLDLASPDSVSSDGSITNPLSRQKAMIYQDPNVQIPSGYTRVSANPVEAKITDLNSRVQMQQQFQETGYVMATQYDPQHHPQLHQQQPQFIHTGPQYIQHHPTGAMPMGSYYPVYPSQQSHHPHHAMLDPQYPVYYVPARQPQAYNMAVQQQGVSAQQQGVAVQQQGVAVSQQGYGDGAVTTPTSRPQTPTASMAPAPAAAAYTTSRNAPAPKSEIAAGMYRTATTANPSMVQVPSSQHQQQYVGFSQMPHPSQSVAPTMGATASYAYEFADPAQAHMYFNQPLPPQMAAQYQTMSTSLPEAAAHLPTDSIKQQVRTSQP